MLGLSLILHIIIETPAAFLFILKPSSTLTTPQPHAHAVIRQYGLLLFCTNGIILILLLTRNFGTSSILVEQRVAGALAVYHLGPLVRALGRLQRGEKAKNVMANPILHMLVHAMCLLLLSFSFCVTPTRSHKALFREGLLSK